jgi:hypothetical protein
VIHAAFNNIIGDAFLSGKIISILSGTGIIFFSYYIARNFLNVKIAILTQLFFVFNHKKND